MTDIQIELPGAKKAETSYRFPVSEVYGPVCQGEGRMIGRPTIFVRFGGCDYRCSWCDSMYAVDPKYRGEWEKLEASEIVAKIATLTPGRAFGTHVTLSGGNPAIQPAGHLIDLIHALGMRVSIETQGSINPVWLEKVDDICVSPKPPSSGNETPYGFDSVLSAIYLGSAGHRLAGQSGTYCHKVVVFTDEDYEYARQITNCYPEAETYLQAGTDVGQASRDDLCDSLNRLQERVLADPDMKRVAVLPQLHAILRGHARGI